MTPDRTRDRHPLMDHFDLYGLNSYTITLRRGDNAMARTDPQFKLRLSSELKAQIEAAAKSNNRSMNAEIIFRMEQSFEADDTDVTGDEAPKDRSPVPVVAPAAPTTSAGSIKRSDLEALEQGLLEKLSGQMHRYAIAMV